MRAGCWQVVRLLKPAEDEIAQHYAVKTIENIASQGGQWAAKFANQDVVYSLVQVGGGAGVGGGVLAGGGGPMGRCVALAPVPLAWESGGPPLQHAAHPHPPTLPPATHPLMNTPHPPIPQQIFNSSKSENLKATTASTLSRLLRSSPPLVGYLLDKAGVRLITGGLADSSSKVQ